MKQTVIMNLLATFLVMLFLYASFSKYFGYAAFDRAMHDQPFPNWFSDLLVYLIPPVEIIIAILLVPDYTRRIGFYSATVLMGLFTLYISGILMHFFPWEPCNCGG